MKHILIIDNYDSFTFNLVQYVEELDKGKVSVVKNDRLNLSGISDYDAVIISPGPGLPKESGQLMQVFDHLTNIPVLGVCLGHQAIGEYFGAELIQLGQVYHGVDCPITQESVQISLFKGLDKKFTVGRYHSWVIEEKSLSKTGLKVSCRDENGSIMGVSHREQKIHGVQFHPESVMTPDGRQIISNFLEMMH